MKIKINRTMEKLLKRVGVDPEADGHKLIARLTPALCEQCSAGVVRNCLVGYRPNCQKEKIEDKTAAEAGWSKLFISGFVDDALTSFEDKVTLAISVAFLTRNRLQEIEPKGRFRVIVHGESQESQPYPIAVCRFHRLWPDEKPWLWEDLERYSDPVLTIDVGDVEGPVNAGPDNGPEATQRPLQCHSINIRIETFPGLKGRGDIRIEVESPGTRPGRILVQRGDGRGDKGTRLYDPDRDAFSP